MFEKVKVEVYRFTGWQGPIKIPEKWRRKCGDAFRVVKQADREQRSQNKVDVVVRPWLLTFLKPALKYGAWIPPIVIVDGKLISQGVVPRLERVVDAIEKANPGK